MSWRGINGFAKAELIATTSQPATFEELAAAASRQGGDHRTHAPSLIGSPPGLSLPAGSPSHEPRPNAESHRDGCNYPFPIANELGRPLDNPTLFGIDPSTDDMGGSLGDAGYVAPNARTSTETLPSPSASGHRPKAIRPTLPLWCGLLTRVIKAGTDEFKSAPCNKAQEEEKTKLEKQSTWDMDTVREWASVRADPTLLEATVARLFVIMGRKGDEMIDARSIG